MKQATGLIWKRPIIRPGHRPESIELATVAAWQTQHVDGDDTRKHVGRVAVEIVGSVERRQMPVRDIIEGLNLPDQIG